MGPRPGTRARGTRSGRPILVLFDLMGRRWAMRIVWELREGPQTFRALRERCDDVSPSVLNTRLKELADVLLVELSEEGYQLTAQAAELIEAMTPLYEWSERWGETM